MSGTCWKVCHKTHKSVFIITHQHYAEHMLAVATDVINCMLVVDSLATYNDEQTENWYRHTYLLPYSKLHFTSTIHYTQLRETMNNLPSSYCLSSRFITSITCHLYSVCRLCSSAFSFTGVNGGKVWNVGRVGEQAADLTPIAPDNSFPGPM